MLIPYKKKLWDNLLVVLFIVLQPFHVIYHIFSASIFLFAQHGNQLIKPTTKHVWWWYRVLTSLMFWFFSIVNTPLLWFWQNSPRYFFTATKSTKLIFIVWLSTTLPRIAEKVWLNLSDTACRIYILKNCSKLGFSNIEIWPILLSRQEVETACIGKCFGSNYI